MRFFTFCVQGSHWLLISPSLAKNTEQKPERTTAIPPARIAVLIQQRNNTEATRPTKPKTPKMVKSKARGYPVQNKSKESHTAITNPVLTRLIIKKLPANREKAEIPISIVKQVKQQPPLNKETGCLSPNVAKSHPHSLSPLSTPRTTVPA